MILSAIGLGGVKVLKLFVHRLVAFGGEKIRIALTGYTGED